jgi:hypothetical protein
VCGPHQNDDLGAQDAEQVDAFFIHGHARLWAAARPGAESGVEADQCDVRPKTVVGR